MLLRVTTGDVELHGTVLPEADGSSCWSARPIATRVFPDPDRYDLDRDTSKLVSFGSGRHFCMGAALARLEARVGLTELVEPVDSYDIDPDGIERVHSINVRGFARAPHHGRPLKSDRPCRVRSPIPNAGPPS
jgi:cytochrome P450